MSDFVTKQDHRDDLDHERGVTGVLIQAVREEWREELRLRLDNHLKKVTLLLIAFFVGLKFNLPGELTGGAVGLVALKTLFGFIRN